jgi:hypothetical protein
MNPTRTCILCSREVDKKDYCKLHSKAYGNIMKKYEQWKKALEISWKEYLSEIAKNPLTGEWARQVAQHVLRSGEEAHVKNS